MKSIIILAVFAVFASAQAGLLAPAPLAYGYPFGLPAYGAGLRLAASPVAYAAPAVHAPVAYAAAPIPTAYSIETAPKVELAYEPVEQHGYRIAY